MLHNVYGESNMRNLKLTLATLIAMFVSVASFAGPYVVYENDLTFNKFDNLGSLDDTIGDLRIGLDVGDLYVEVGKFGDGLDFDSGESVEIGISKSVGKFTVEGNLESFNTDSWEHKLETKVKYSF